MGIYSNKAREVYLESDLLYGKHNEDYFKSKMFYGNIQVLIDARSDSEAQYFQARAINDFDTFKQCYRPSKGDKLNGIVLKQPLGESNDFIACTSKEDGSIVYETVSIKDGKIVNNVKTMIEASAKPFNNHIMQMDNNQNDYKKEEEKEDEKYEKEQEKKEEAQKENANLAIDF